MSAGATTQQEHMLSYIQVMYSGDLDSLPRKSQAYRPTHPGGHSATASSSETLTIDNKKKKALIKRLSKKQWGTLLGGLCIVLAGTVFAYWRLFIWQPAIVDPFTNTTLSASVDFPLYYPTQMPTGYRIDRKSTTSPQAGVVVFDAVGPNGAKLYISEEARPTRFNLGGFYEQFKGLKEIGVSDGAIAVGKIASNNQTVASRANNTTWILANSAAQIPQSELITMMKSLALH